MTSSGSMPTAKRSTGRLTTKTSRLERRGEESSDTGLEVRGGCFFFSARGSPVQLCVWGPAKGVRRVISFLHQNPSHVYYFFSIFFQESY